MNRASAAPLRSRSPEVSMNVFEGGSGPPAEQGAGGLASGPSGAVKTLSPAALSVGATLGANASPSWPAHSGAEVVKGLLLEKPDTSTTASTAWAAGAAPSATASAARTT